MCSKPRYVQARSTACVSIRHHPALQEARLRLLLCICSLQSAYAYVVLPACVACCTFLRSLFVKLEVSACLIVCLPLQPFFEAMHRAIRPGGMVCTQVRPLLPYCVCVTAAKICIL